MSDLKLTYYTADWCMPCKAFRPTAEKEAEARGIPIEFLNADLNPDMVAHDQVMTIPTIVILGKTSAEGYEPVGRVTGASPRQLVSELDRLEGLGYNG